MTSDYDDTMIIFVNDISKVTTVHLLNVCLCDPYFTLLF